MNPGKSFPIGVFSSPSQRFPYVPPLDRDDNASGGASSNMSTLLGGSPPASNDWISALAGRQRPATGRDPNIIPANDPGEDVQIAQQPAPQPPRRGSAPFPEPDPGSAEFQAGMTKAVGHPVMLPDGSRVPTSNSDTGYLMSPIPDLRSVATAGRQVGETYRRFLESPETEQGAWPYLVAALDKHLGHGGRFDYQREGNGTTGFTHYPHFRDVSNFNVGLFCQQSGMTLDDTLSFAGQFARWRSSNADPSQPYGLNVRQAEFIKKGFRTGAGGVFEPSPAR